MASLRQITQEQYSDGTNIDGTRLEKGLNDIQQRANNIPLADIATKYKPNRLVGGYYCTEYFYTNITSASVSPNKVYDYQTFPVGQITGRDNHVPSVIAWNESTYVINDAVGTWPDNKKENPVLVKGTNTYIDIYSSLKAARNFVTTQAYQTSKPIIIKNLTVEIQSDELNPLYWNPLSGSRGGIYDIPKDTFTNQLSILQIALVVDDPDKPESVQLRTTELLKQNFRMGQGAFRESMGNTGSVATITPSHPGLPAMEYDDGNDGYLNCYFGFGSLIFTNDNLDISIPANSRFRMHILLPDIQQNTLAKFDLFEREITFNLTFLEEIVE